MRIAVDGYELGPRPTGVGRYLRSLLLALLRLDFENSYTLFVRQEPDPPLQASNLETVVLPGAGSYSLWQNFPLRRALAAKRYDLLFAPNYHFPLAHRGRVLLVIHDVSWRARPRDIRLRERLVKDFKCRWNISRAWKIVCDSEFTKKELARFYHPPDRRVHTVWLGVEDSFSRSGPEEIARFKARYGIGEGRVLGYAGTMFGRRHVSELIEAFQRLKTRFPVTLFLVGQIPRPGPLERQLRQEGIIWREWLPEEEMNPFYSALDLFLYLSDYEGFGLPPLEALCCGAVPLLLRSSSLTEVFAGIALFSDDPAPETIAASVLNFFANEDKIRPDLRARWNESRGRFSWQRVARSYLELLRDLREL